MNINVLKYINDYAFVPMNNVEDCPVIRHWHVGMKCSRAQSGWCVCVCVCVCVCGSRGAVKSPGGKTPRTDGFNKQVACFITVLHLEKVKISVFN